MCPGIPCHLQVWSPDHQEHLGNLDITISGPTPSIHQMFHLTRPRWRACTLMSEKHHSESLPEMGRQPASLTRSWGTRRSRWSTRLGKRSCAPSGHRGSHRWSGRSVPSEEGRGHEGTAESPECFDSSEIPCLSKIPPSPHPADFFRLHCRKRELTFHLLSPTCLKGPARFPRGQKWTKLLFSTNYLGGYEHLIHSVLHSEPPQILTSAHFILMKLRRRNQDLRRWLSLVFKSETQLSSKQDFCGLLSSSNHRHALKSWLGHKTISMQKNTSSAKKKKKKQEYCSVWQPFINYSNPKDSKGPKKNAKKKDKV